ncbi:MAG: hypothetical protein R2708_17365 [Vicinamibacterales bacterium]
MSVRHVCALLLALATAACGGGTPAPPADAADLVILNGKVHVADEANTVAEAVAVKGTTIQQVGTTARLAFWSGRPRGHRRRAAPLSRPGSTTPTCTSSRAAGRSATSTWPG